MRNGCLTFQTITDITGVHNTFNMECMSSPVTILFAKKVYKLVYKKLGFNLSRDYDKSTETKQTGVVHNIKPQQN